MADELREYVRNYEQCFVAIETPKTGAKRAFVPIGVGDEKGTVSGLLITKNLSEKRINFSLEYLHKQAKPIIPSMGYYNVSAENMRHTCAYVDLPPARQYRKALDGSGTSTVTLVRNGSPMAEKEWAANFSHSSSMGLSDVSKLLANSLAKNPARDFPSFREALYRVESGEAHAVAISRFICLTLYANCRLPVILYKNTMAGLIDGNRVGVGELLYPLRDFFYKRWNINLLTYAEFGV